MNNLIIDKLKVIKQLQSLIKLNELGYRTKKSGRNFDFSKYSLPVVFSRDIHEGVFLKDANKEQSKLSCILNNVKKKILRDKKSIFWKKVAFILHGRENILKGFKSKIILIKTINQKLCQMSTVSSTVLDAPQPINTQTQTTKRKILLFK